MAAVRCLARRLGGSLFQRTQAEEGLRLVPSRLMRSRLLPSEASGKNACETEMGKQLRGLRSEVDKKNEELHRLTSEVDKKKAELRRLRSEVEDKKPTASQFGVFSYLIAIDRVITDAAKVAFIIFYPYCLYNAVKILQAEEAAKRKTSEDKIER